MQRITNQRTRAQGLLTIVKSAPETVAQKIERTRAEVRRAITDVQASEGRFLDYETADMLQRTLFDAARNLQELTLQVAYMERKK
jgi:hypothetical protein